MGTLRDPEALQQVARLYYVENLSQQQIATRLGISRSNVSRMLGDALAQGIVEIRINDPARRERSLEAQLQERFGLRDARVAQQSGAFGSSTGTTDRLGSLAAELLVAGLREDQTIALSWGLTLQAMVRAAIGIRAATVVVVPLVGSLSSAPDATNGPELVRELASRLGAAFRSLPAPAMVTSSEAAHALLREPPVADTLAIARRSDIAFVGIQTPDDGSSPDVVDGLGLTKRQAADFWRQQPVGTIAGRWFDGSGHPVGGPVDERVIGVTLDDIGAVPTVVALASGRAKARGVLGALAGGLVDVLVCDESLAGSILDAGLA